MKRENTWLYGLYLKEPYVKKISGKKYKKIFELRVKFSSDISRIFYFSYTNSNLILLNGYTKKKNKTDTKELELALKYMKDYEVRYDFLIKLSSALGKQLKVSMA